MHELVSHGHEVVIEKDAGVGSSIPDADYQAAGAQILATADDVWGAGDLILKVKEPVEQEYGRMREGQTLFTYLHLAADKRLTEELVARKVTGIAYETSSCGPVTRCCWRRCPGRGGWLRRSARTR